MQHTILHTTAVQSPSHFQWYILIGKQWYQLPEFIPSNSDSVLHSLWTTTTTIVLWPFVWDCLGDPVSEEMQHTTAIHPAAALRPCSSLYCPPGTLLPTQMPLWTKPEIQHNSSCCLSRPIILPGPNLPLGVHCPAVLWSACNGCCLDLVGCFWCVPTIYFLVLANLGCCGWRTINWCCIFVIMAFWLHSHFMTLCILLSYNLIWDM